MRVTSSSKREREAAQKLGGMVVKLLLIAPTLMQYIWLAHGFFVGTTFFMDEDGASHTIPRYRTDNFEQVFFCASVVAISTVFVHSWLTLAAVGQRYRLAELGAVDGLAYNARLKAAELEASRLTKAEWAHIALFGADFFFAGMIVFPAAMYCESICANIVLLAIGPGLLMGLFCSKILTRARAVVLSTQRTKSVSFAGDALRGSLNILIVQFFVLARFMGYAYNLKPDLYGGDCAFEGSDNMDPATNMTWKRVANITSCTSSLFFDGIIPQTKAKILQGNIELDYHTQGSYAMNLYLGFGGVLFYLARGQGVLHDRLFTHLVRVHAFDLRHFLLQNQYHMVSAN